MSDVYTYFYKEGNLIKKGCCGFLSGSKEDHTVIIQKSLIQDDISDSDVKTWIEIINKCYLPCEIVNLSKSEDESIVEELKNIEFKRQIKEPSYDDEYIFSIANKLHELSKIIKIKGYEYSPYVLTGKNTIDASIVNNKKLYRFIYYEINNKLSKYDTITLTNVKNEKNRIALERHFDVNPKYFNVNQENKVENLYAFIIDFIDQYKEEYFILNNKKSSNSDKDNYKYYAVKMHASSYLSKVHPRSINSAIRMIYTDMYKKMLKTSVKLYKDGFSAWDSLYLSHIVKTSEFPYDPYYGLFSNISYYFTEKQLRDRIEQYGSSTNLSFTRQNGVSVMDRNIIDQHLVNNDYKSLLKYLKLISLGDDKNIGGFLKYSSESSSYMTSNRFYEIQGANEETYLVLDDFLNNRHISKSKFKTNE